MSQIDGPSAAWLVDPLGRYPHRWWDGTQWTDRVSDGQGGTFADPLGVSVGPPTTGLATLPSAPPAVQATPPPAQYYPPSLQTPDFNLPGGGAWAAPQQLVVTNASKSPGLAIASLVLGVGAFFFSIIPVIGWASIPFAIVGLALGISGILRANKGFEGRGMSIAGVATSLGALLISAVYIFAVGAAVDDLPDANSDPSNGICDESRFFQDPDC